MVRSLVHGYNEVSVKTYSRIASIKELRSDVTVVTTGVEHAMEGLYNTNSRVEIKESRVTRL